MISYLIKKDGSFPDKWLHSSFASFPDYLHLGDGLVMRLAGTLQQVSIRLGSSHWNSI